MNTKLDVEQASLGRGVKSVRRADSGKALRKDAASLLALKPVSKHGSITVSQASRAVRAYRDGVPAKTK